MRVDPGELDQRIRIIRHYTGTENGYPVEGVETVRSCWAKAVPEKGSEFAQNEREAGEESIRFLIRCGDISTINRTMQVEFSGGTYEINYVRPYIRAGYAEIMAMRRT
jgi:SPP1 family predicted phage head-tail adaptor